MRTKSFGFALLFAALALGVASSHAETPVSGDIATTTWLASGSPYRVTGTVTVPAGNTLTIEPGVDVLFDADVQFVVNGNLQALGTEAQNIRFMKGTAAEWGGIRLSGGQANSIAFAQVSGGHADGASEPDNRGGGIHASGTGTTLFLDHVAIVANRAENDGGGVFVTESASVNATKCVFRDNVVGDSGGGLDARNGATIYVSECVFQNNVAENGGGSAILLVDDGAASSAAIAKCTVVGNSVLTGHGAVWVGGSSSANVSNCIFWGNAPDQVFLYGGTVSVAYSDIQGGYAGDGNINADPLFVNAATGDFRLMAGSPCIDAGDPASPLDPDGTRAEMGAFFFDKRTDPYHVGGTIETTSWPAGGTYHVIGNVFVQEGATLTIGQGTDVLFDSDAQIHVYGAMQAVGQEGSPIRFMQGTSPQWGGIRFWSGNNTLAYVEVTGVSVTSDMTSYAKAALNTADGESEGRLTRAERRAQLSNASRLRQAQAARAARPTAAAKAAFTDDEFPAGAVVVSGEGTTLDLSNSSIHGNTAVYGAGIYVDFYAQLTATSCIISDNHATHPTEEPFYREGGGVAIYDAQAQFTNCTFAGNTADDDGGGVYVENYSTQTPVPFVNCVFSGNVAETWGGGAIESTAGVLDLNGCTFTSNSAGEAGGGVDAWNWDAQVAGATITGCEFRNNAAVQGGAVWVGIGVNAELDRSLFAGNTARPDATTGNYASLGGAVYNESNSLFIANCTFSGNHVQPGSGYDGYYSEYGGAVFTYEVLSIGNSILWGNSPEEVGRFNGEGLPMLTVRYSDFQGYAAYVDPYSWNGTAVIDEDPLFVNPAGGDFTLQKTSPCVDAGDPESARDPDGTLADMGAFPTTQTTVSGDISEDTIWYKSMSPYRVLGPVNVFPGVTLTIEPGVDVLFDDDLELTIAGSLQAVGTPQDSIRFLRGHAAEWGGISIRGSSSTLSYARISGAVTPGGAGRSDGGGLYVSYGTALISHCTISGNHAARWGGGVGATYNAWTTLDRCLITGNTADVNGSGASYYMGGEGDGALTITNSTIANNTTPVGGAALYTNWPIHVTVRNSVLWADVPTGQIEVTEDWATVPVPVTYSNIQGGYTGAGNFSEDPQFVAPWGGDFRLQPSSPCINTGDPAGALDADGTVADIGAFWFDTRPDKVLTGIQLTQTLPEGVYRVTNDILIPAGQTLTLSDTDLRFDAPVGIAVLGNLQAMGAELDSVRFLPGLAETWAGIVFDEAEGLNRLHYARVSGVHSGEIHVGAYHYYGSEGAITLYSSSVEFNNTVISGNSASGSTAGVSVDSWWGGQVNFSHCTIADNIAYGGGWGGGGMAVAYGSVNISRSLIARNSAYDGGGVFVGPSGQVNLENCTIADNTASGAANGGGRGAGVFVTTGLPENPDGVASLHNCIVWGMSGQLSTGTISKPAVNRQTERPGRAARAARTADTGLTGLIVTYTDVNDEAYLIPESGNIIDDPLFVDAPNGDYHLSAGSPCIDAGDTGSPYDPDNTIADMGAFPFFHAAVALPTLAQNTGNWVEGAITGTVTGRSLDLAFTVDPSVVETVAFVSTVFEVFSFNPAGANNTVYIGLSNAAPLTINDDILARIKFKIRADAIPQPPLPLAWVGYPETAVDEAGVTLINGSLQVLNRAPEWMAIETQQADPKPTADPLTFVLQATDGDNHGLVFSMVEGPPSAQFQTSTQTFTWKPTYQDAGTAQVIFRVTDGYDAVDKEVTINVVDYYGDPTLDGTISTQDASQVLKYSVHLEPNDVTTNGTFEVGDVSDNGFVTAYDAGMILYKAIVNWNFIFPARAQGLNHRPAEVAAQRTIGFVQEGDGWDLMVSDPDGIMGCDLTVTLPEGALAAFSGDGVVEFSTDGNTALVGIARAEFSNPVLLHVSGTTGAPGLNSVSLNEGAIPAMIIVPVQFSLAQNAPNPFNPSTTIMFGLPGAEHVRLAVYDVNGRLVRTLIDGQVAAGSHEVLWDGSDGNGRAVASGVYVYRLTAKQDVVTRRMTLVR
ncbi:MAG: flagellar basal body rod modification protein [Candidatus Latescibacteria bacterium ADurb.Bin168]|nr:MAG: flagellar basal body rod modification protein [Candidatus Latescibacteria bacterium ADurb.Bin168]